MVVAVVEVVWVHTNVSAFAKLSFAIVAVVVPCSLYTIISFSVIPASYFTATLS